MLEDKIKELNPDRTFTKAEIKEVLDRIGVKYNLQGDSPKRRARLSGGSSTLRWLTFDEAAQAFTGYLDDLPSTVVDDARYLEHPDMFYLSLAANRSNVSADPGRTGELFGEELEPGSDTLASLIVESYAVDGQAESPINALRRGAHHNVMWANFLYDAAIIAKNGVETERTRLTNLLDQYKHLPSFGEKLEAWKTRLELAPQFEPDLHEQLKDAADKRIEKAYKLAIIASNRREIGRGYDNHIHQVPGELFDIKTETKSPKALPEGSTTAAQEPLQDEIIPLGKYTVQRSPEAPL